MSTTKAPLPNPKHGSRVPAHLSAEQLARIQHNAYLLPQVVKPADFVDEHTPGLEHHLDHLGYIQLQKAAARARPSRWIAPDLMEAALEHIDAVGSGPQVRALMLARTATLEALGV